MKKSADNFQKFFPKKKNSVIKEEFRQKKKDDRKLKNEYFEKIKAEKQAAYLVNLIEYNPIPNARFRKPDDDKVEAFMNHLSKNRVNARLRRSRGKDIDAACGQLANKKENK